ncbi:hypothetical protein ThvES_00016780 [Thiovulum sp. ES]|nr:hypothetical protein ThvES_00016780 [Thiovulum sp. ES]
MVSVKMADLRKSESFFKNNEILQIIDGRKKVDMGYFVPIGLKEQFEKFLAQIEHEKRITLLKRVAEGSRQDPIEDGAVGDGIK